MSEDFGQRFGKHLFSSVCLKISKRFKRLNNNNVYSKNVPVSRRTSNVSSLCYIFSKTNNEQTTESTRVDLANIQLRRYLERA